MFIANPQSDSADNLYAADIVQPNVLRNLGGEPLEGSGFEKEKSDPAFQFDWTRIDQTPGGLR